MNDKEAFPAGGPHGRVERVGAERHAAPASGRSRYAGTGRRGRGRTALAGRYRPDSFLCGFRHRRGGAVAACAGRGVAAARDFARIRGFGARAADFGRENRSRNAGDVARRRSDRERGTGGAGTEVVDSRRYAELPGLGLQSHVRSRRRGADRQDAGAGGGRRRYRSAGPDRAAGVRGRPRVFRQRRDVGSPQHSGRYGRKHRRLQFAGRPVGIYGRGHRRRLYGHQYRDAARQAARRFRSPVRRVRNPRQIYRRRQCQYLRPGAAAVGHRAGEQCQYAEFLVRGYSGDDGAGAGQRPQRQRQLHGAAARRRLDGAGRGGELQRRVGRKGQDYGQLFLQPGRQPQRKPDGPADLHLFGKAGAVRRRDRCADRKCQPPLQFAFRLQIQQPPFADDAHGVQRAGLPARQRDLQPYRQQIRGRRHPLREPPPQLRAQRQFRVQRLQQPDLPLPAAGQEAAQPDFRRRRPIQRRGAVQPAAAVYLPRSGQHRGRYGCLRRPQYFAYAPRTARLLRQRKRDLHPCVRPAFAHERRLPRDLRRQPGEPPNGAFRQ